MEAPRRVLDRYKLLSSGLAVDLDAAEAGKQVSRLAMNKSTPIELGHDLHRKLQIPPGPLHHISVGHRSDEIAAKPEEGLDATVAYPLAGLHRIKSAFARRLETVLRRQAIERCELGLFGNADSALALHVRVAAHRKDTRAGFPDIAAQKEQIAQHLNGQHARAVLRQTHAVKDDRGPCSGIDFSS